MHDLTSSIPSGFGVIVTGYLDVSGLGEGSVIKLLRLELQ